MCIPRDPSPRLTNKASNIPNLTTYSMPIVFSVSVVPFTSPFVNRLYHITPAAHPQPPTPAHSTPQSGPHSP
jgi:hypothetical protein